MSISTLRPGLLVSLKTSVVGNVTYAKKVIETEHLTEVGEALARWETERKVTDPVEHEAAKRARNKAASLVRSVCAPSAFGLLCPESSSENLDKAVAAARAIAEEFNKDAKLSRIYVYVITGRIAADDEEAVRAINSEVRDLLVEMEDGVRRLDVKAIRDAASRTRELGAMLSPDAAARIQIAIDAARASAKRIVQAGEMAAQEVDQVTMRKIAEMRTAFLDLDPAKEIAAPAAEQRALDLAPATAVAAPKASTRAALEVE